MVTYTDERLGVDVNRQWEQFNGELVLVDGTDNVEQAIFNRLTCILDDMSYFYDNYGSRMKQYMGQINNYNTLDSLSNEVADRVLEDPRVNECECRCVQIDTWAVAINIKGTIYEDIPFENNLVLDTNSFKLYDSSGVTTYLQLALGSTSKYDKMVQIRHGDTIKILCRVMAFRQQGVPIGVVDFYMDHQFIKSVEVDEFGYADWVYDVPSSYPIGMSYITAHYRGLGRFASCKKSVDIRVVDKLDTVTRFRNKTLYGVAGEYMCYPTSVKDFNGGLVRDGKVVYSLNFTSRHQLGTVLTISDMYKVVGDDVSCVFENANLVDELGDAIPCGVVHFYINNGDGFLKATKTILSNTYALEGDEKACFNSRVVDEDNKRVLYGAFEWYLRRTVVNLATNVEMPDIQTMMYGNTDCLVSTVTDEDGYGVQDGIIEWFVRCFRGCKPYESLTTLTDVWVEVGELEGLINAVVTDADGYKLLEGEVMFSMDDTPLDIDTLQHNLNISSLPLEFSTDASIGSNSNLSAMIVDGDGTVIDVGRLVSEENEDGEIVSNYVSSDDEEVDENTITIEVKPKENDDGE